MDRTDNETCDLAYDCLGDFSAMAGRCQEPEPHCGACSYFEPFEVDATERLMGRCRLGVVPRFFPCRLRACKEFKARVPQAALPVVPGGALSVPAPAVPARASVLAPAAGPARSAAGPGLAPGPGISLQSSAPVYVPPPAAVTPPVTTPDPASGGIGADTAAAVLRRELERRWKMGERAIQPRYVGGRAVVRSGEAGEQEFSVEQLFRRLNHVKGSLLRLHDLIDETDGLSRDERDALDRHLRGLEGSLTTFNFLFRDKGDGFQGSGGR